MATRTGSTSDMLKDMQVGDRLYIETTLEDYPGLQRRLNVPHSRRQPHMRNWMLRTALFTAVSASVAGDVRYLVCVERLI